MKDNTKTVLVSYTCNNGVDSALLLVGEKKPGKDVEIVNAIQGKKALMLWTKLTVKENKVDG